MQNIRFSIHRFPWLHLLLFPSLHLYLTTLLPLPHTGSTLGLLHCPLLKVAREGSFPWSFVYFYTHRVWALPGTCWAFGDHLLNEYGTRRRKNQGFLFLGKSDCWFCLTLDKFFHLVRLSSLSVNFTEFWLKWHSLCAFLYVLPRTL